MTEPTEAEIEELHQIIYKAVHGRVREFLELEALANAVWLGTQDAAKAIAAAQVREREPFPPVRPFKTDWVAVAAGLTPTEHQGEDVLGMRKGEE